MNSRFPRFVGGGSGSHLMDTFLMDTFLLHKLKQACMLCHSCDGPWCFFQLLSQSRSDRLAKPLRSSQSPPSGLESAWTVLKLYVSITMEALPEVAKACLSTAHSHFFHGETTAVNALELSWQVRRCLRLYDACWSVSRLGL